ncbi:MAG: cytochrome c [Syntrophales bacterium]|nr:cytochrome c [Syntrophales bacterium]MDD5640217.1 cytochrome c [Syntrophales bacterium]
MKKTLAWVATAVFMGTILMWSPKAQCALEAGRSLYIDKCALCHGAGGDGKGPAGDALSPKPTDFTSSQYWQTPNNQRITAATLNGVGAMPAFDLDAQEMKGLIDYMRTFKK